ncbi:MAG: hypothetical protein KGN34_18750 [Sphingomonadales bacterium]|nr:hypothetical protein [Sphingomonadales bacterium]
MIGLKNPHGRRYSLQVGGLMLLYGGALVAANSLVPGAGSPALKLAFAVLPALPIVGVFVAIARLITGIPDEYVRMLLVRQSLVATAFMLSIATAWGFAESFDVAPHVPAYYAAILWFAGLGFGGCVNAVIEHGPRRGAGE